MTSMSPPASAAAPAAAPAAVRRPRSRRGEGDRLRPDIIAAATRLLLETGDADSVSIRSIADAVGVSSPAIYLHFPDKAALLYAVCEEQFQELDRVIEGAVTGATDPGDALRRRARAYLRFGLEHPEQYRILFMCRADELHAHTADETVKESSAFQHLVDSIDDAITAGLFPAGDAERIAVDLWVCVHGVTSLRIAVPNFPWPDDPDTMLDRVLAAYCTGLTATTG